MVRAGSEAGIKVSGCGDAAADPQVAQWIAASRIRGQGAAKVERGLRKADTGAGVVVLPDLGSAVLTVRAVLEDLPGQRVIMADAPFVEGAVAATVTAAGGGDVAAVAAAAEEARHARKL